MIALNACRSIRSLQVKTNPLLATFRHLPLVNMPKRKSSKSEDSVSSAKKSKSSSGDSVDSAQKVPSESSCDNVICSDGKVSNMKIVSWNVNGIRAALKNKAMDYFNTESCDILCLQETKCSEKDLPVDLKSWKEFPFKYFCSSEQLGYAGVALFSKKEPTKVEYGLNIAKHDTEGRLITAHYDQFVLINAYIPNAGRGLKRLDYRMDFDNDLLEYMKKLNSEKPVILCGDLNVSHTEIDLENPKSNVKNAGFTPEERSNFTTLLKNGFVDSFRFLNPGRTKCYTFWSYMRNARAKNIGWRLDYFVVSKHFMDNVCQNVIRSDVMGSDHCPIVLYLCL